MKIALAQLNYHIGNFESNISKIKKAISKAKKENTDLIIFAELAICGYPPRDFLEFNDFIIHCENAVKAIASDCHGIAAIVGSPSINPQKKGKSLYNSAYFLNKGKIVSIHNKALLPNYDVFDEYRYFEPSKKLSIIKYKGIKIALTICEDIWDEKPVRHPDGGIYSSFASTGENSREGLYTFSPMHYLIKQNPDILINVAASPFDYAHAEIRKKVICTTSKKYRLPLFYVNHVGSQTELIFDGGSMVCDAKGNIIDELKYFEEEIRMYEVQSTKYKVQSTKYEVQSTKYEVQSTKYGVQLIKSGIDSPAVNLKKDIESPKKYHPTTLKYERIHNALILGIKDYFIKMNFQKAIVGLSGGIDSAVVLVLAAQALGKENVKALLMPSRFSSEHSVSDAKKLAENIGCSYEIISIRDNYKSILKTLKPYFNNLPFNIAEENLQARIRAVLLMAFTNKFGYILLNTTNKSEAAVGYGTLYGDMCGGLSVLGDVYKTEVFELAKFINESGEKIPKNILSKPPSAELRPNQKDSDSLPPYEILDKILYKYIEMRKSPDEIIKSGFEEKLIKHILQMVNTNEYKRYQMPPVLRVSPKAFGMGRRMPIAGKYLI